MNFREQINQCDVLPIQNSNRGHEVSTLLESFITSVWCGANRFLHTEVTRSDRALSKIFDWKTVPGQYAYKRYFNKFDHLKISKLGITFSNGFLKVLLLITLPWILIRPL